VVTLSHLTTVRFLLRTVTIKWRSLLMWTARCKESLEERQGRNSKLHTSTSNQGMTGKQSFQETIPTRGSLKRAITKSVNSLASLNSKSNNYLNRFTIQCSSTSFNNLKLIRTTWLGLVDPSHSLWFISKQTRFNLHQGFGLMRRSSPLRHLVWINLKTLTIACSLSTRLIIQPILETQVVTDMQDLLRMGWRTRKQPV
jgi:hypothetical protein